MLNIILILFSIFIFISLLVMMMFLYWIGENMRKLTNITHEIKEAIKHGNKNES